MNTKILTLCLCLALSWSLFAIISFSFPEVVAATSFGNRITAQWLYSFVSNLTMKSYYYNGSQSNPWVLITPNRNFQFESGEWYARLMLNNTGDRNTTVTSVTLPLTNNTINGAFWSYYYIVGVETTNNRFGTYTSLWIGVNALEQKNDTSKRYVCIDNLRATGNYREQVYYNCSNGEVLCFDSLKSPFTNYLWADQMGFGNWSFGTQQLYSGVFYDSLGAEVPPSGSSQSAVSSGLGAKENIGANSMLDPISARLTVGLYALVRVANGSYWNGTSWLPITPAVNRTFEWLAGTDNGVWQNWKNYTELDYTNNSKWNTSGGFTFNPIHLYLSTTYTNGTEIIKRWVVGIEDTFYLSENQFSNFDDLTYEASEINNTADGLCTLRLDWVFETGSYAKSLFWEQNSSGSNQWINVFDGPQHYAWNPPYNTKGYPWTNCFAFNIILETIPISVSAPEFPSILILPLLMMATLLGAIIYRKRRTLM